MDLLARRRIIDAALCRMDNRFGQASIPNPGAASARTPPVISSGCLSLDLALGAGGFPRGRIIEIFGPESSGKTTVALHTAAEAQRQRGTAAFIDAEHALDAAYARRLGVDVDGLLVSQPDHGEQALEIAGLLIASGVVDLVVLDSVAALVPKAELEGTMGDEFLGLQARMVSQAMRKLAAAVARTDTCLIFLNQIREKIGVVSGNPETTAGGRALKFYASVRLEVRALGPVKDDDAAVVGTRARIRVVKNSEGAAFRDVEIDLMHGDGISKAADLLDLAVMHKLVDKSGSWFRFRGEPMGQGRAGACRFLREHQAASAALECSLRKLLGAPECGARTASPR